MGKLGTWVVGGVLGSLGLTTQAGCVGMEGELAPELAASAAAAQWTRCANSGQLCSFQGTRQVRYGTTGRWTLGVFTNGIQCVGSRFGVASSSRNRCEYDASGTVMVMPPVNEAAIPIGDPGVSGVQIRATSEVPTASFDGTGNFRTVCKYSHMNFDDPILYPGQERRSHLHAYFGNAETDAFSTQSSLQTTGNSTCRGGIANRSAYWVPALLDRNGVPQKPEESHFYYKSGYGGIAPAAIRPFPPGLRMVAGDMTATAAQPHAYWGCWESYIGHPATIPTSCGAGNHLAMTVDFPQCWNGRDLDSPDHRSHMAYPENGGCPATHPVPIPEITFHILYRVPSTGVTGFRLASDMYGSNLAGGLSAHADWFAGWDPALVTAWVQGCTSKPLDCHSHLVGDGREMY